eukprot:2339795-Prymnesium_polylepis.1
MKPDSAVMDAAPRAAHPVTRSRASIPNLATTGVSVEPRTFLFGHMKSSVSSSHSSDGVPCSSPSYRASTASYLAPSSGEVRTVTRTPPPTDVPDSGLTVMLTSLPASARTLRASGAHSAAMLTGPPPRVALSARTRTTARCSITSSPSVCLTGSSPATLRASWMPPAHMSRMYCTRAFGSLFCVRSSDARAICSSVSESSSATATTIVATLILCSVV